MKVLNIFLNLEVLLIIVFSVIIIVYSTNLQKQYPEKIVDLMKEKGFVLLFIGIIYYFIYNKKYTIAILSGIIFSFMMMDIPLLTESFIDSDFGENIDKKQQELFSELEKLNNNQIVEKISGGKSMDKIKEDLKDVDSLLKELD